MNVGRFLEELSAQGVELWADGEKLRYRGPADVLTSALLAKIKKRRAPILNRLRAPARRPEEFELSQGQIALWYIHQNEPRSSAYNVASALRIRSALDVRALERALHSLGRRHPALRTVFPTSDGTVHQRFDAESTIDCHQHDASGCDWSQIERRLIEASKKRFSLERGPVFRVDLWRRAADDYVFLQVLHHIVGDGWSTWLLWDDLWTFYRVEANGGELSVPAPTSDYSDFVGWQRKMLDSPLGEEHRVYWQRQLAGDLPVLRLPVDRPRPEVRDPAGDAYAAPLTALESRRLTRLARKEGTTLFTLLLSSFQTLLSRYSTQEEILVGVPTVGRRDGEFADVVGYFANPVVVRSDFSGAPTFRQILRRVRETVNQALAHQDYPFSSLVSNLAIERDLGRSPIFQVLFVYQQPQRVPEMAGCLAGQGPGFGLGGVVMEPLLVPRQDSQFDLTLEIVQGKDVLYSTFKYSTALFDRATVHRFVRHFVTLLQEVVADPVRRIAEYPILGSTERHQLTTEWARGTARQPVEEACLHQRVKAQAILTPDAVAVECKGRWLSYGELERRAAGLASSLRSLGVGPEVRVGICAERRPAMVVGVLGVLEAGAAYVPLDPAYPSKRQAFMVEDSEIEIVLTRDSVAATLPGSLRLLDLDGTPAGGTELPIDSRVGADNLAYVIYTSGSTGRPKGVAISHRNAVALLDWARDAYSSEQLAGVLASTSLSFDLSVFELFVPLSRGGRVILADGPMDLAGEITASRVTLLNLVPSAMAGLLRVGGLSASIRHVNLAGEPLSRDLTRDVFQQPTVETVCNLYGPSEDTTYSTYVRLERSDTRAPSIGRPLARSRAFLLDKELEPVPLATEAEIYLGGAGLSRGYLRRPALTAAVFGPDPIGRRPGERLYRTGDLGRYRTDGEIEFLGRLDDQIKLSGFRIEPGEIESTLMCHAQVREAVVVLRRDSNGRRRLGAIIGAEPARLDESRRQQQESELLAQWRSVFEDVYEDRERSLDPALDTRGWRSSLTGEAIASEEMEEWADRTVDRLLALRPKRVLEVGCGTGLVLWRLAPHCVDYCATDFSPRVLESLHSRLLGQASLRHVRLAQSSADDLGDVAEGVFDTVVLNSLVQYFPSVDYFLRVLRQAVRAAAPGGSIFIGDVRNLALFDAFCVTVELARAKGSLPLAELRSRLDRRRRQEKELLIAPGFFRALRGELTRVRGVRILPRVGRYSNEMNRFRYDAVLELDRDPAPIAAEEMVTIEAVSSLDQLRHVLADSPPMLRGLGIRNPATAAAVTATERLHGGWDDLETVADLNRALEGDVWPSFGLSDLEDLGREMGYDVELRWPDNGDEGAYDALFHRPGEPWPATPSAGVEDLATLANDPLQNGWDHELRNDLQRFLERRLPRHLWPATWNILETLPRLPNGKIDRRSLPSGEETRPEGSERQAAPRDPVERALVENWTRYLGREQIGIHDNFFAAGGDSIISIQIVAQLRQQGLKLAPSDFIVHQTIAELAAATVSDTRVAWVEPRRDPRTGDIPLTPIQCWFFGRHLPEPWHFNQAMRLGLRFRLDPRRLALGLTALIEHHDALRLRFEHRAGGWHQASSPATGTPFHDLDLSALREACHERAKRDAVRQLQASLCLTGPLLRMVCFDPGAPRAQELLLIIHHLAVDGVSWRVLLADLDEIWRRSVAELPVLLPAKTTTFREWAECLSAYATSPELEQELGFWQAMTPHHRALPVDFAGGINDQYSCDSIAISLDVTRTRSLLRREARIDEILLAALARTLAPWIGRDTLLIELEGHGREEISPEVDLSRTVGWLTTAFPFVLELADLADEERAIASIRQSLRALPNNGLGFGVLRYLCGAELPRPELVFNYLGQLDSALAKASVVKPVSRWGLTEDSVGPIQSRRGNRSHRLEINSEIVGSRLRVLWSYSRNLHHRATIEELAQRFLSELEASANSEAHQSVYPLTPIQNGLLFHALAKPELPVYFEQYHWQLSGDLEVKAFRQAWQSLVLRHDVLRTSFDWQRQDEPRQIVWRDVVLPWQELDVADEDFEDWLASDRRRGFDLSRPPLLRVTLVRRPSNRWRIVWSFHHLILDGWSWPVLLQELFDLYDAHRQQRQVEERFQLPFRSYVSWLAAQDQAAARSFWQRTLRGFTAPTPLPLGGEQRPLPGLLEGNRNRSSADECHAQQQLALSVATESALRDLARRLGLTMNVLLEAAWALLLARHAGTEDIVFGMTVSGRSAALAEPDAMIGLYVNTLPLRVRCGGRQRLRPWLQALQAHQAEVWEMHYSSLVSVKEWSEVEGSRPLFESLLVFDNYPVSTRFEGWHQELGMSSLRWFSMTNYPLYLLGIADPGLSVSCHYDPGRFEGVAVRRLIRQLGHLLEAFVADEECRLENLSWLSPSDRHQLVAEWNDTNVRPRQEGILELFEAQVRRTPAAVALVGPTDEVVLSYAGLNMRANRLAHDLRRRGVAAGVRVGIALDRSPRMAIAVLAILKAGGAYVPLDPAYPAARLSAMMEEAEVSVLVTRSALLKFQVRGATVVSLDRDAAAISRSFRDSSSDRLSGDSTPGSDSLFYIVFTSGSTGRPKGIALPYRAMTHLIHWHLSTLKRGCRVLQFASLSFDVSAYEMFAAWCSGGSLWLIPEDVRPDGAGLADFLASRGIDKAILPVVMLQDLAHEESHLGPIELISTGEQLRVTPSLNAFLERQNAASLHNHYGPAETHVVTAYEFRRPGPWSYHAPVGRAIANSRAYVLDKTGALVPPGVRGELLIGGTQLARGYLTPKTTAERFVPDPYDERPGARLYRTGDLACLLADGNLELHGRRDHQVKLRGLRVEPQEVETVLVAHPGIREAVVLLLESDGLDQRLIGCVIPEPGGSSPWAPDQALTEQLRHHLLQSLPAAMVPSVFLVLDSFPLGRTGKVDRGALCRIAEAREVASLGRDDVNPMLSSQAPIEELVAGIWCQVLGREQIPPAAGFVELGGHSLMATRVVSRVRRLVGVEVAIRDLFDAPNLADFARRVQGLTRADSQGLSLKIPRRGQEPPVLSFAQERLWFIEQLQPGSSVYNLPLVNHLAGELSPAILAAAFAEVVRRHAVLRTHFVTRHGRAHPIVREPSPLALPVVDLQHLKTPEEDARELLSLLARRPFDLEEVLLRAVLVRLEPERHLFFLNLHHIVTDGLSTRILMRELGALYTALWHGEPASLNLPAVQYSDYAAWQRQELAGEVLTRQLEYWRSKLVGTAALDLPTDRRRPPWATFQGAVEPLRFPSALSETLRRFSRKRGATVFMTLLSALFVLLARLCRQSKLVVGTPVANRGFQEVEDLIGLFVNSLVLRADLSRNPSFKALLRQARETALDAYAHQDVPFEKLVEELRPQRDLSRHPLFQVTASLEEQRSAESRWADLTLSPFELKAPRIRFDLEVYFRHDARGLAGSFLFARDLFDRTTIRRWARSFESLLRDGITHADRRATELALLSSTERHQLQVEWRSGPIVAARDASCFPHRFEVQARRTPDAMAVSPLTYRQLDRRAGRLARRLRIEGVGTESVVGLHCGRSTELLVGILGVLKAGAAYLPLPVDDPRARKLAMLRDSGVRLVLVRADLADELKLPEGVTAWCLRYRDDDSAILPLAAVESHPDSPAYVLYTSGSTGQPKGVVVTHRGLDNYLTWACKAYGVGPGQTIPVHSDAAFDLTLTSLLGPLIVGGTVRLVPEDSRPEGLAEMLERMGDHALLKLTPSHLRLLRQQVGGGKSLRARIGAVVLGGESLNEEDLAWLRQQVPGARIFNEYGPTETVVGSVCHEAEGSTSRFGSVAIGRPIAQTRIYLLDNHGQPVPVAVSGEIYLGGAGLARGYLNRPGRTAEAFRPDPLAGLGRRLYKTGDLAVFLPQGHLRFVGRRDGQLKIRGFRIEPGEIEAVLENHPAVRSAVVVATQDAGRRLVAYIVSSTPRAKLLVELRAELRRRLPVSMWPTVWSFLESLPRLANGKVDRLGLPPPPQRAELTTRYIPPRDPAEEILTEVFSTTLGVDPVGVHDNFFELGGHSLNSLQIVDAARRRGLALTVRDLFENQTVAELALIQSSPSL